MFVVEFGDECDASKIFWGTLSTRRQITMQKCWWLISKTVWLYCIFFSALKPKFAASEKIKELSTELVMVNVEASEKLIITFTMFTMFN